MTAASSSSHPVNTLAASTAVNLLLGLALTEMLRHEFSVMSPVCDIQLTAPADGGAARERYLAALATLESPCDASIAKRDEG